MNTIDIVELNTEHARYKTALEAIYLRYPASADAFKMANAALNPPPPIPVTLDLLKGALKAYNAGKLSCGDIRGTHHIKIYEDGSGGVYQHDQRITGFNTTQEIYEFLVLQNR